MFDPHSAHLHPLAYARGLADAARSRSEADWLVGINGTRAMTAFNSRDGGFYLTTVGRVQTPTLAVVVGAIVYKALNIWLVSQTDWSKLVLGGFVVLIVVAFPKGIVGTLEAVMRRRRKSPSSASPLLTSRIETAE